MKNKRYKKQSSLYNAVFYSLVAIGLFIWGFNSEYSTSMYALIGAILVSACAGYWIWKAWKKKKQ